MRHRHLTACVLLVYSSGVYADVRYTTHVEVRLEPSSSGNSQDIGLAMQKLMSPGDAVTYVSANAIRIEQTRDGRRTVVLLLPDGQVILDPEARTYTRVPELGDVLREGAVQPPPRFKRTGDFAVIHGVRGERVEVTIPVTLPVIPPPGFPTSLAMTGEMWIADAFSELWPGLQKALGLTVRLPTGLQGIVLRQILRNREFGYEVESTVTELTEGPIDPAMLTIPEGYREASGAGLR